MGVEKKEIKGWTSVPEKDKEIIKKCIDDFLSKRENKEDALNTLFEMYNKYMGGSYHGRRGRSCHTCINRVVSHFDMEIRREHFIKMSTFKF